MKSDNITVIVRSVGERTESKCVERLKKQFETDDIIVVQNIYPFSACLRKTYEIAIKKDKKWAFVVDADVLFDGKKLQSFFLLAEKLFNENVLCIMGAVYDNFMQKSRYCGVHLYYVKNIPRALQYITSESKRPESFTLNNMDSIGYTTYKIHMTLGIHDFFQSYRDIVAKGILHSVKHSNMEELHDLWEREKNDNPDFVWMLKAYEIAKQIDCSKISADAESIRKIINDWIKEFPFQQAITDREIDEVLHKYADEVVCERMFFNRDPILKDVLKDYVWNLRAVRYFLVLKVVKKVGKGVRKIKNEKK